MKKDDNEIKQEDLIHKKAIEDLILNGNMRRNFDTFTFTYGFTSQLFIYTNSHIHMTYYSLNIHMTYYSLIGRIQYNFSFKNDNLNDLWKSSPELVLDIIRSNKDLNFIYLWYDK